jgi:hypothetical protein
MYHSFHPTLSVSKKLTWLFLVPAGPEQAAAVVRSQDLINEEYPLAVLLRAKYEPGEKT